MDIDVLTGWSREIQAPMDPEGSMRPTYRHADLLGLSELVLTQCVCVCVCVCVCKKYVCVWITQVERMRVVLWCYPVSGGRGGGIQQVHAVTRMLWLYLRVGSAMQVNNTLFSAKGKKKLTPYFTVHQKDVTRQKLWILFFIRQYETSY